MAPCASKTSLGYPWGGAFILGAGWGLGYANAPSLHFLHLSVVVILVLFLVILVLFLVLFLVIKFVSF